MIDVDVQWGSSVLHAKNCTHRAGRNGFPSSQSGSDTEGDTDTQEGSLYESTTETNNAHDAYTSKFASGLVATATDDDNGSTDTITDDLGENLTDVHGLSGGPSPLR